MLVTSHLYFSGNVFYPVKDRNHHLHNIQYVVYKCFQFQKIQSFVVWCSSTVSISLETAELKTTELKTAGLKTAVLKTAGLKTAVPKTAELKTTELTTAGLKTAELKTAVLKIAELKTAVLKTVIQLHI